MYLPRANSKSIECIVDRIRMCDLKKHVKFLSAVIARFINLIIDTGHIPVELKCSIVRPYFKNGDHSLINNKCCGLIIFALNYFK